MRVFSDSIWTPAVYSVLWNVSTTASLPAVPSYGVAVSTAGTVSTTASLPVPSYGVDVSTVGTVSTVGPDSTVGTTGFTTGVSTVGPVSTVGTTGFTTGVSTVGPVSTVGTTGFTPGVASYGVAVSAAGTVNCFSPRSRVLVMNLS